jgi:hypothetical protein
VRVTGVYRRKIRPSPRGKERDGLIAVTSEQYDFSPADIQRYNAERDVEQWLAGLVKYFRGVLDRCGLPTDPHALVVNTKTRKRKLLAMVEADRKGQPECYAAQGIYYAQSALRAIKANDTKLAALEAVRADQKRHLLEFVDRWEGLILQGLAAQHGPPNGGKGAAQAKQKTTDELVSRAFRELPKSQREDPLAYGLPMLIRRKMIEMKAKAQALEAASCALTDDEKLRLARFAGMEARSLPAIRKALERIASRSA